LVEFGVTFLLFGKLSQQSLFLWALAIPQHTGNDTDHVFFVLVGTQKALLIFLWGFHKERENLKELNRVKINLTFL
jgi:hypothetical protein